MTCILQPRILDLDVGWMDIHKVQARCLAGKGREGRLRRRNWDSKADIRYKRISDLRSWIMRVVGKENREGKEGVAVRVGLLLGVCLFVGRDMG